MKKIVAFLIILSIVFVSSSSFAMGMPEKHGVDGRTFGSVVSELARTGGQNLADHVRGPR